MQKGKEMTKKEREKNQSAPSGRGWDGISLQLSSFHASVCPPGPLACHFFDCLAPAQPEAATLLLVGACRGGRGAGARRGLGMEPRGAGLGARCASPGKLCSGPCGGLVPKQPGAGGVRLLLPPAVLWPHGVLSYPGHSSPQPPCSLEAGREELKLRHKPHANCTPHSGASESWGRQSPLELWGRSPSGSHCSNPCQHPPPTLLE